MKDAQFDCNENGNQLVIKVNGDISAETKFPTVDLKPDQKITIYLQEAGYVNSAGVQNWMSWIYSLQQQNESAQFTVQFLPANFVRLAYQIRNFLPPNFQIQSFSAPYYCPVCDALFKVEFVKGANWKEEWTAQELTQAISFAECPTCQAASEFDGITDAYSILQ